MRMFVEVKFSVSKVDINNYIYPHKGKGSDTADSSVGFTIT